MEFPQLKVSVRKRIGKGPARRLRRNGLTPAVLYGSNFDSVSLSVSPSELIKALSGPLRTNTVLDLTISKDTKDTKDSGYSCKAIVRDHQFDPVSRNLLHVDFVAIDLKKKIEVKVPLRLTGRSLGEQAGGKLAAVFREISVECLPDEIPEAIIADISHLKLNETMSVGDVVLPKGITVTLPEQTTIALVQSSRAEEEKTSEAEDGQEAAEGEGKDSASAADQEKKS